ncbi:11915_t:CDS:2 [Funneliformis geosporum]|uniref:11252_t:CDS:1 n=1 Tax=Funneliformis geosporum TaxID=1117311 RepID=A0A9W4SU93_9GLOM|nr:11252_t:CDS:2 [Funneliformis geosporum]CAI2182529.1 11915_t:CDS:2 [Funneliformis geosporum]
MPPNTTNSKSTATTANSGTTQMNSNNKSTSTPKTSSRQRRATSASSYVFAPSWLTNLTNKSGSSTTVLSPAYSPTTEGKSVKEEVKGWGTSKKDGLGSVRQAKEGLGKDGSTSLNRLSANGISPLSSTRSKSRDFSNSRSSVLNEAEKRELPIKVHGRSRSVSQTSQPISSSSFDKNFPTLAKKKEFNLSVDLPAKNVENIWAKSDTKSKLLSPTSTTPGTEEPTKFFIPNMDNEPELERRMSLVPKVESGKLDGKRTKHIMKRKTSRSLSVDSVARGLNGSSVFGFGIGIGISNGRSLGQTQYARPYLRETVATKPTNNQPQRQRSASISTSKTSTATSRISNFGQSSITGRRLSASGNSKYLWSNTTMGKMGYFKIFPEEEEDEEVLLNDRKENVNPMNDCDHIEEEDEEEVDNISSELLIKDISDEKTPVIDVQNNHYSDISTSSSIEREERFLLQLGWKKPYNVGDADTDEWAITEEEKRWFVNFVRTLNGFSVLEKNDASISDELSYSEINRAKKKWVAILKYMDTNGVVKN